MIDWRTLCRGPRFKIEADEVVVSFENDRHHRVKVRETSELFEFSTVVAKRKAVEHVEDLPNRIWQANRATQLVGFRIDSRGRVCGEGWIAKAGVTADEFQLVLRQVASASDRLEFLLTGQDVE